MQLRQLEHLQRLEASTPQPPVGPQETLPQAAVGEVVGAQEQELSVHDGMRVQEGEERAESMRAGAEKAGEAQPPTAGAQTSAAAQTGGPAASLAALQARCGEGGSRGSECDDLTGELAAESGLEARSAVHASAAGGSAGLEHGAQPWPQGPLGQLQPGGEPRCAGEDVGPLPCGGQQRSVRHAARSVKGGALQPQEGGRVPPARAPGQVRVWQPPEESTEEGAAEEAGWLPATPGGRDQDAAPGAGSGCGSSDAALGEGGAACWLGTEAGAGAGAAAGGPCKEQSEGDDGAGLRDSGHDWRQRLKVAHQQVRCGVRAYRSSSGP
jgi:hypothetical protein